MRKKNGKPKCGYCLTFTKVDVSPTFFATVINTVDIDDFFGGNILKDIEL